MVVAGVMSGTSADGVDVAVCRISAGAGGVPRVEVMGHLGFGYPKAVRAELLRVMEGGAVTSGEMSRLHWRLGGIYADCVEKACKEFGVEAGIVEIKKSNPPLRQAQGRLFAMKPQRMGHPGSTIGLKLRLGLVGCHGQTVFHEARLRKADSSAALRNDKKKGPRDGVEVRSTWQMGEASVIAERLRVPVVSDFRPADLAAGGQGAPLVPMLDWVMFRSATVSRVLQNLGGIGNLTAIPAGAGVDGVLAFDTGPGNMVIDECMSRLYGRPFDGDGHVARTGRVLKGVVESILQEGYFSALPPKSFGREQFGTMFVSRFIADCRKAGALDEDVIATATALTVASVMDAYRRFVEGHLGKAPKAKVEFVVAGGGVKNDTLMGMLREGLEAVGVGVLEMEELGVEAQAKEAVAFALLAWLTWNRLPGNVVSATGASRAVVLGKVTYG